MMRKYEFMNIISEKTIMMKIENGKNDEQFDIPKKNNH